jgi:tetratricopeptide (TPR) repeat protein/transcriptional regulator with XRE-family HTH domain
MTQGQQQARVQDGKVILNAENLKALRKQRGLSQDALAALCLEHRLCVSIASIKRAETGKSVLYRTASHLAKIYASDLEALIRPAPAPDSCGSAAETEEQEQRSVLGLALALVQPVSAEMAASVQQLIEQFGGQVEQAELAIFGLPRAYGSDAVRCLQCAAALALLLQGQRGALVIGVREWPRAHPESGARHAALLPAGVTGVLPVFVERSLGVELGERFVFGASGDAGDWLRFLHARPCPRSVQSNIIGRHVELRQFKAILETTLAYQTGHILYLRGVAGIGKSRLIHEFADIASHNGFDCHSAAVLDFGVSGGATPLAQLLRSLFGLGAGMPAEEALMAQMRRTQLPEELAMHYRTILGMPQPPGAAVLFGAMSHAARDQGQIEALHALILRRCIEHPLLLIFEDIHWSNPELIGSLAALLPDVQEAPVVWVLSSRFEQDPLASTLRPFLNGLPVTMFDLATLRTAEALALALQAGDPDPDFHAQCVARAQGNPLFLTQLLLSGRTRTLPSSLKNLVQTKLDELPAPQRRALRVASAIGQRFPLQLLRQVLNNPAHTVELAVQHFLVRPAEQGSFIFVHDLVMQGIYESMPSAQRDSIHEAIAHSYGQAEPQLRAQHLHRARHPDAPAAFLAAIAERSAAYQYQQALELIDQCQRIDYAARDDCELNLLAGQCHAKMGQTRRAKASFSAARELARDQRQAVAAVIGLARALNVLEDMEAEELLLDQAIATAQASPTPEGLGELYYLKGNIYFPRGNFARSRELHELARRHAHSKDGEARAMSGIGDSYYAQGRMATAHKVFSACLALCEQHGLADIEASNRFMLGTVRLYLNQTAGALKDALASAELGRLVGNRRAEIVSRLTAGWALISTGQVHAARQQIEQGLSLTRAIGATRFEPFLNESLARVLLLEGRPGAAFELAVQAWEMVQLHKLQHFIGPWVLGTVALLAPAPAARQQALAQGQALLEQGCVGHNYYRFYVSAMETCLLEGQAGAARAMAERFTAFLSAESCPWALHHIALAHCYADWLDAPAPVTGAALARSMQAGQEAGLRYVMPLLHQHVSERLTLE